MAPPRRGGKREGVRCRALPCAVLCSSSRCHPHVAPPHLTVQSFDLATKIWRDKLKIVIAVRGAAQPLAAKKPLGVHSAGWGGAEAEHVLEDLGTLVKPCRHAIT